MEIWKDLSEYESLYKVSNLGRVKSLPRKGTRGGILLLDKTRNKYLCVQLHKNGKQKNTMIHRLVAEVFLDNKDNKPYINHKDCDKFNNKVENLEWCTHRENIIHSILNGIHKIPDNRGENHGNSKLTRENVLEIRSKYIPRIYTLTKLASEYGVYNETIRDVVNGKTWNHV